MINSIYFSTTVIDELTDLVVNLLKKPLSEADTIFYIFLVRCVNVLVHRKRKMDTKLLPRKLFELEQKIGNADTIEWSIYDFFIRERERYYASFAIDSLNYQE